MGALGAASADGDREQLRRVAHTLKSNAATFGAERLALACEELERAARNGEGADGHELVGRIEAEAALATPALTAARDDRSA